MEVPGQLLFHNTFDESALVGVLFLIKRLSNTISMNIVGFKVSVN